MSPRGERALDCPSAQPGMTDARILGVVGGNPDAPRLAYLNERVAATPEILGQAAPAPAGEIFRLAARCEEARCTHFDGTRCRLASRIVALLPEVVDSLPPCILRPTCRWHEQEGRAACLRCPQVVTLNSDTDELMMRVALAAPGAECEPGIARTGK